MRVLALFALLADTGLVVGAQYGLGVLALLQSLLLNGRDRLEQGGKESLLLQLFLLFLLLLILFVHTFLLTTSLVGSCHLVLDLIHKPKREIRKVPKEQYDLINGKQSGY